MGELYVPKNFGHGYLVIEPSIVSYICAEKFYGEYDDGIIWNDPDIGIEWPLDLVDKEIILSEKDKNLQCFKEFRDGK
ncbi:dTDP-4-dehydrorhamnose 3,5-epimerase family protein [Paenibacillus sp. BSR1-1]|uniref:dTDP-4-dehydrorhamnose 3,5-epimerase family protein n=1 Tax=Paenibacillus sp. BSR1-1 TaxID=3020845 RepID=UPI0025B1695F|nr:dTDP-4-dehydrorhamnose 3,5-epimerase family protein [Paenibacillus sp. BSR1-1]MDN3017801.1 dTDP-4-dehydrorhamnose 3,5-epimerase family protein [Paenibacillus sp. BSR1-1]